MTFDGIRKKETYTFTVVATECDQLERTLVGDASGRLMCLRRLAHPRRCESTPVVTNGEATD